MSVETLLDVASMHVDLFDSFSSDRLKQGSAKVRAPGRSRDDEPGSGIPTIPDFFRIYSIHTLRLKLMRNLERLNIT